MMDIHWRCWLLLLPIFIINSSFGAARYHNISRIRPKRENGENMYLPASYIVPGGERGDGWGPWETPSACSRSCGGGVTSQIRRCAQYDYDGRPVCQGGSVKYYSCNTQDCPEGSIDYRSEQCSSYDDQLFDNITYQWVPYTKAPNPCELNCMPKGDRFYFRHSVKVADGTRCNEESLDVCVNGECQHVGCDMMLGSNAREDKCRQCNGDSSSCNTIVGSYDNDVTAGYNDILLIPMGATNIVVKERQPSNNYLAIRNREGNFYLNGNWKINIPKTLTFSGCIWHYERTPQGFAAPDLVRCIGPISEPIYVVLLSQETNVGIDYEYSIPTGISPNFLDEYNWIHSNFTPCTATCGGGYQTREVTCASRGDLRPVSSNLCDEALRPLENQTCANVPCAPQWVEGEWNECTKPCGEGGTQSRQIFCEKIISHGISSLVHDNECFESLGEKPAAHQKCNVGVQCPAWHVGPWNPCNKLCGEGKQRRSVTCYRKNGQNIEVLPDEQCTEEKPENEKTCILHPCEGVDYIISEWSGCDSCTSKVKTRTAYCASTSGDIFPSSFCSSHPEPILEEACDIGSLPACDAQWYTSQWSKCSGKCGNGVQSRRVFCGIFNGESLVKVPDEKCKESKIKYETSQPCELDKEDCLADWHAGPWSECSKLCGAGEQERKVLCLRDNKTVGVEECSESSTLLSTQQCNTQACTDDEVLPVDISSTEPTDDDEDWCDDEDYEDIESETESSVDESETEKSVTTDELMLSDSPSTDFETGSGDYASTVLGTDETTDMFSGDHTIDITSSTDKIGTSEIFSTGSDLTSIDGSGDSTIEKTSDSSTVSESLETTKSPLEISSSESSSSSESTESTSSEKVGTDSSSMSSEDSSASQESVTDISTDTTSASASTVSSLTNTDTSTSASLFSTDSTSAELSSTDTSTTDSSTTDSSTTDSSTTDSSTADSSTTDGSSTDLSTTDISMKTTVESSTSSNADLLTTTESIITTDGVTEEMPQVKNESNDYEDDDLPSGATNSSEVSILGSSTDGVTDSSTDSGYSTDSSIGTTGSESSDKTDSTSEEASTIATNTETDEGSSTEKFSTDITTTDSSSDYSTDSTSDLSTITVATDSTDETTSSEWSWSVSTIEDVFAKESTTRKCKKRPSKQKCSKSKFGCCSDNKTAATGPFEKGCPNPETCKDTKHGCCLDGVSPAKGPNNKGCPILPCKETLFGCCKDKKTPAQGNNEEGCPPPPPPCKKSKYGCCGDEKQEAKGPNKKGCPETTVTTAAPTGCKTSEFGCCDDEKTEATGPNKEGCPCSTTKHGCCPDEQSAATGPNNEGCELGCNATIFRCCPDGQTPAHGPLGEGCCLSEQFGCCPDNIQPARGPNFEGCKCESSPYGCCPDNETAAKGYNNEGCGCKHTPHGCCPNRLTPALGPNYDGCPCHTYQFGCCPDGKRVAKGPRQYGCSCSESEFGCCSDEQTAASGPDKAGCDCAASKYGCCPDGINEAKGEDFEGCEDKPENLQLACGLEKDRGNCTNDTIKWFYDTDYGGCSRFWYGGCGGNNNKFRNQEECEETCMEPPGKAACSLPKMEGPCAEHHRKWYYDANAKSCRQFIWKGCLGNNNKFETREECSSLCEPPRDDDEGKCMHEADSGICGGNYIRWAFDKDTQSCQPFRWGGCGGNSNRFITEDACILRCNTPGKMKDACMISQAMGSCSEKLAKWSFNRQQNRCIPFYYTGCEGNDNQFESEEECDQNCPKVVAQDICTLEPMVGDCDTHVEKWYYNSADKGCQRFYYGGCGGNKNNFNTEEECSARCGEEVVEAPRPVEEPFQQEYCLLPYEEGSCDGRETRWYYDSTDGICKYFPYSGCDGNRNNFRSREECEGQCLSVQDVCQLPMVVGPCPESISQWFYDKQTDSCSRFSYGGCQGNNNRFETRDDCEQRCKQGPPDVDPNEVVPVKPDQQYSELPEICFKNYEPGNCDERIPAWYYNATSQRCQYSFYSGCGGNSNKFTSVEQCERQCGQFVRQEICRNDVDTGPCNGAYRKVYFNEQQQRCVEFIYGGCGGNGNRFSTIRECESVCLENYEPSFETRPGPDQAICSLPPDMGNCPHQHFKRWYYSKKYNRCIRFIYTGCGGNRNNFDSYESCVEVCNEDSSNEIDLEPRFKTDKPDEGNPCQPYEMECETLRCPYGITKSVQRNGCERCRCNDPCAEARCQQYTTCQVEGYQDPQTGENVYNPVCRPIDKPGQCPVKSPRSEECVAECNYDVDCGGQDKCCEIDCSRLCATPTSVSQPAVTSAPVTNYRPGAQPPVIEEAEEEPEVSAEEGNLAVFKCIVHGNPPPTITWRKDSITIDGDSGRYRITSDGILQIVSVYRNDSGVYICFAENGIGEPVTKEFNLRVTDPENHPSQVVELNNAVVGIIGQPLVLRCLAYGWPKPFIQWWYGQTMLPVESQLYERRRDYSLLIRSLSLASLGDYVCYAYNGIGKPASWTVRVKAVPPINIRADEYNQYRDYLVDASGEPVIVTPKPQRPPVIVPEVTKEPQIYTIPVSTNITVDRDVLPVGADISILCRVDGYPNPDVYWLKDQQSLQRSGRIDISDNNRLTIVDAQISDSGEYRCEASNQYSSSFSTVRISVEGQFIHPNCTDNPFFANCALIVKAQYCNHKYYARFCCRSCTKAGLLSPYELYN